MGPVLTERSKLVCLIGLVFVLCPLFSKLRASSVGSCFRIRYKNVNGCDQPFATDVTRRRCCSGYHRRAWRPNAPPTLPQGHAPPLLNSSAFLHNHIWGERDPYEPGGRGDPQCQPCKTSCHGVTCGEDQKCVLRGGVPKCVCNPKCYLQHKAPVCGTDDRTYSSECQLLKRSCRKKKQLFVKHSGPCQTCSGVKCKRKRSCALNELLIPRCIRCPESCSKSKGKRLICGTDGVTYISKCHLKMASCRAGIIINKAYKEACREDATCDNVKCWRGETCLLRNDNNQPQCVGCKDLGDCSSTTTHICASDGHIYQSLCALKHASCRTRVALTALKFHNCAKSANNTTKKILEKDKKCALNQLTSKLRKINKIYSISDSFEKKSPVDPPGALDGLKGLDIMNDLELRNKRMEQEFNSQLRGKKKKRKRDDC